MKNILQLLIGLFFAINLSACGSDTYEKLLEAEKNSISNYMNRNGYTTTTTLPTTKEEWGNKLFYVSSTGVYTHIIDLGEDSITVPMNSPIIVSYIKYPLDSPADIVKKVDAEEVILNEVIRNHYEASFPYGLVESIQNVIKHHNAKARVIVPSKQGTSIDMNAVVPYGYDIEIKIP